MTLERKAAPCVTTNSTDEWLEGLHFDTAERAMAVLRDAHQDAELVVLPEPCWCVVCDGCGADLEDDEVRLHLPSARDAETVAREIGGWASSDGRLWFCESCRVDLDVSDAPDRIPVMAGQEVLF
jgi:hypothetical protein